MCVVRFRISACLSSEESRLVKKTWELGTSSKSHLGVCNCCVFSSGLLFFIFD